jgi:p-cumate 2,3-dioxygenase subunit beta
MSTLASPDAPVVVTRDTVVDFLLAEAAVLDRWDLDAWLTLFLPEGTYEIPTPDAPADATPATAQFFIADDAELLRVRVTRLHSKNAHAEQPRSQVHRLIGLPTLTAIDPTTVRVHAPFVIHRIRDGHHDPYLGWYDHLLVTTPDGLRYRRRRSVLAGDQLRPGSRLSFIL